MTSPGPEDWAWQLGNLVETPDALIEGLPLSEEELRGIEEAEADGFRLRCTPYYRSLIDPDDPNDPIRIQCVPSLAESVSVPLDTPDPLAEEAHTVAPNLIQRYPDRVLLLATDRCATHCRHCTRRRRVGRGGLRSLDELEVAFRWIEDHSTVREVLFSGGDPLVASDIWIERILKRLRAISHLELIRGGTRVPVTLPQRVTPSLCEILGRFTPLYVTTHFNHPRELTREAVAACCALADAGIPLANQAVLLEGVNDSAEIQLELCRALLRARVRPYYVMQCDSVRGTGHLRVSVERGLAIMASLRGQLSGLGIPTYVLDLPGGGGKVVLSSKSLLQREGDYLLFVGPEGATTRYYDPSPT